ncbi:MAG: hypothetical protein A3K10_11720 [Bacteroidetes bacterium RIFCSPLOWO2_12_FULL_31_6]|nr:MAG: hypothetical protein A3K10_11720 [Bacteroidetes bacterium RIFCSPLOWO2_12_FULL_31_6]
MIFAGFGREKAGAETLLQFAGLGNFLETFEPLSANLRTGSKEGQPAPGTIQILNSNYKDDLIKVYPNPNNGNFYLDYHIDELSNGYFILTDISGKEMWRKTLTKNNETVTLNLSQNTPPGMYLYQIVVNGEVFTIDKLIITQ